MILLISQIIPFLTVNFSPEMEPSSDSIDEVGDNKPAIVGNLNDDWVSLSNLLFGQYAM